MQKRNLSNVWIALAVGAVWLILVLLMLRYNHASLEIKFEVVDFVSLSITILLGIFAVIQARQYKAEADRQNRHTFEVDKQIYLSNVYTLIMTREMYGKMFDEPQKPGKLRLTKDRIQLKKDAPALRREDVITTIESLPFTRKPTRNAIATFLSSSEDEETAVLTQEIDIGDAHQFIRMLDTLYDCGVYAFLDIGQ